MKMSSIIDFAAECGGRDAGAAVMPHFKALKAASRGLRLEGFPFPDLTFILRVDGEITQYQLSGPGNIDVDRRGEYLSVDIGITVEDRKRVASAICGAILSSVELIGSVKKKAISKMDSDAVRRCLLELVARYKRELASLAEGNGKS